MKPKIKNRQMKKMKLHIIKSSVLRMLLDQTIPRKVCESFDGKPTLHRYIKSVLDELKANNVEVSRVEVVYDTTNNAVNFEFVLPPENTDKISFMI